MRDEEEGPRWGPAAGGAPNALVVLLHGVGADGFDLIDLAPGWGKAVPGALFIAPHAPEACDLAPYGRQWFSLQDRRPIAIAAGADAAAGALFAWIDGQRAALGLGWDRVAIMGFSQGAMMTLRVGLHQARQAAALLAYSGALPCLVPPGPGPAVLIVHGEEDEVVPAGASRNALAAIEAAGLAVEAAFRPGLGHGIDEAGISLGALALQKALGPAA
ncbi:phospholipase [Roseomonas stagni]|uniref:Phospholipase n=1 Tax=Falsiroseomonas algicola TaxID=2716930 RepID=A0A6M1LQD4_9PROT|nr:dienelactone hydrolase family protein [Falsiroseomonas algicola]NGM22323.1 phospholipase [Falsiroseomonas algicola]